MINDNIKMIGDVCINLFDETGAVKDSREIKNLVVTAGRGFIASRMKDATVTAMSHMEIGTSTTAAALDNTTLGSALASSRVALGTITVTGNQIQYVATFPAATGTGAVTEAGIFNNAAGGTMLCRTVFSVVNKGASDTLTITWTVTVS